MSELGIIIKTAPHGTSSGRESLDCALALSESHSISLFFLDAGIFQLLPAQLPELILMRDYIPTFKMLDLYDVKSIYISEMDVERFNIDSSKLVISTNVLSPSEIHSKMSNLSFVLNF